MSKARKHNKSNPFTKARRVKKMVMDYPFTDSQNDGLYKEMQEIKRVPRDDLAYKLGEGSSFRYNGTVYFSKVKMGNQPAVIKQAINRYELLFNNDVNMCLPTQITNYFVTAILIDGSQQRFNHRYSLAMS